MQNQCELTAKIIEDSIMYGVKLLTGQGLVREYDKISMKKREAQDLVIRLNGTDVSLTHLDDIVRDYILELAYSMIESNGLSA